MEDVNLIDIIFFFAYYWGSPDISLNFLNRFEKAIKRLEDFPMSGSVPKYSILRRQGYRVLIAEKYLVFYYTHIGDIFGFSAGTRDVCC